MLQAARAWQTTESQDDKPGRNSVADSADADERRLLEAGRRGDHAALTQLLARHEADLLRLCRSALPNSSEAEDAVQETFLRFLKAYTSPVARFRGEASVKTWLFRIAVNLCLDWRRRDQRQGIAARVSLADEENDLLLPADGLTPEEAVVERLTVQAALKALPPRQRTLLILREQEQWSTSEIAAVLHWNERKVRHELSMARETLARWREKERV